jgi:hypothetical protein
MRISVDGVGENPMKNTVTVTTYVVVDGAGVVKTEPTRDYEKAKSELYKLRAEYPAEFHHIETRTAEVTP